jgi:hypothetical protein
MIDRKLKGVEQLDMNESQRILALDNLDNSEEIDILDEN